MARAPFVFHGGWWVAQCGFLGDNVALALADPRDGSWYAALDLGSFAVLRDGLPQQHAYDLVYRHGLAIDDSGERLAFGSTTGGLWTSEDQGDRWRGLPARLPPIHAVTFAGG